MRRVTRVAAILAVASVLVACKGDAKLPTSKPARTTTSSSRGAGASPAAAITTLLATTGTTTKTAAPSDVVRFPTAGAYKFQDTVTPDDGSRGSDRVTYFSLTSPSTKVVRVQESDAQGVPQSSAFYEERHDGDGLWLTASSLASGVCEWQPKSASLPRRVITGGTSKTDSSCKAGDVTLQLTTTVKFKAIRDVTIAGRTLRCVDVTRHRVLSDGTTSITSDAVDTFSFSLGMRVATSEHASTEKDGRASGFTRNLVLVSPPS